MMLQHYGVQKTRESAVQVPHGVPAALKISVAAAVIGLEVGRPTASREAEPANSRIDVHHHGLDNVRVEGLEPGARQRAESALREFGEAIRSPKNHQGSG